MCSKFQKLGKKAILFSFSPLAIALALALNPHYAVAQTYEYTGKWVADDFDPSMPPFLHGSIVQKNASGAIISETDFSYVEGTSSYGFREGQDWSCMWTG